MTSNAYQMSSQFNDAANLAKDPENKLLWRFQIQRLDAEIVRDSILAVSGALNPTMGGLPFFEVFDLPDQNLTCGARNVSTVPTQALTLMNDDFVLRQAKLFADRVNEGAPNNPEKQIDLAYHIALGRQPAVEELRIGREFLA